MRWRQYTGRAHPERIESEQPPLWPRERPRPKDRPLLACADNLDFMGEPPSAAACVCHASPEPVFFTFVSRVRSDDRRYRREFDAIYVGTKAVLLNETKSTALSE